MCFVGLDLVFNILKLFFSICFFLFGLLEKLIYICWGVFIGVIKSKVYFFVVEFMFGKSVRRLCFIVIFVELWFLGCGESLIVEVNL